MFKNISPCLVRSCKTCPANLGVRSCLVKKLICPVRLSPKSADLLSKRQNHEEDFLKLCVLLKKSEL